MRLPLGHHSANRPPAPLNAPGRLRRLTPFLVVVGLGLAVALLARGDLAGPVNLLIIVVGAVALAGALLLTPWEKFPPALQILAPLAAIVLIAFTREAIGGAASGLAILLVAPMLWSAIYGTDVEVITVIAALALALGLPIALQAETAEELTRVAELALVSLLIAWLLRGARRDATTDALTGVANRRAWDLALEREVDRAVRTGVPGAVVLTDLDLFKLFNDARGHAAGDALLRATADIWRDVVRPYDLLARVGGEEFAVLLPATDADEALVVANRLRRAVPEGQTCSAGVAVISGRLGADTVMRAADAALYEAKETGRNRVVRAQTPVGSDR